MSLILENWKWFTHVLVLDGDIIECLPRDSSHINPNSYKKFRIGFRDLLQRQKKMKGEPCKLLEIVWLPVPRRGKRSLGGWGLPYVWSWLFVLSRSVRKGLGLKLGMMCLLYRKWDLPVINRQPNILGYLKSWWALEMLEHGGWLSPPMELYRTKEDLVHGCVPKTTWLYANGSALFCIRFLSVWDDFMQQVAGKFRRKSRRTFLEAWVTGAYTHFPSSDEFLAEVISDNFRYKPALFSTSCLELVWFCFWEYTQDLRGSFM